MGSAASAELSGLAALAARSSGFMDILAASQQRSPAGSGGDSRLPTGLSGSNATVRCPASCLRLQRQAQQAALGGGVAAKIGHAGAMHDTAVVHDEGPIAHGLGEAEILLHQQDGRALALQL